MRQFIMIFKKLFTFVAIAAALLVPAYHALAAGNIDSTNKYSQFLNIDLDSDGNHDFVNWNPTNGGATVADTGISGYIWGDTVGWINLAPTTSNQQVTVTCGANPTTDPAYLGGYAWGQNTGWINFAPSAATGVNKPQINPTTGAFSGYVWAQNYGYMQLFSVAAGHPGVITTWRGCGNSNSGGGGGTGGGGGSSGGGGCMLPNVTINGICQLPASGGSGGSGGTGPGGTGGTGGTGTGGSGSGSPTGGNNGGGSGGGGPTLPSPSDLNPTTPPPTGQTTGGTLPSVSGTNRGPIPLIPIENFAAGLFGGLPQSYAWILPIVGIIGLLSSVPGLATRLGNLILAFIFGRKKQRGIVYDSKTKEPLDPAYVSVLDAVTGQEILTQITDIHGRYGFVLKPGTYKMSFNKTHYQFPSVMLAGKTKDEVYDNLYFGDPFTVQNDGQVITQNVPMDPVGTDWNQEEKRRMNILKWFTTHAAAFAWISDILFVIGFIVSLVITYYMPVWWNILIACLYVVIAIAQAVGFGPVGAGIITRNGQPLAFAIVRVYNATLNHETAHTVTSAHGNYYVLVPKGHYYITVETKNSDGTTAVVFTSTVINAKQGLVNKSFNV